jgi:hypothetical protein
MMAAILTVMFRTQKKPNKGGQRTALQAVHRLFHFAYIPGTTLNGEAHGVLSLNLKAYALPKKYAFS